MSIWNRNLNEFGGDCDWLAYPPDRGGWLKIALLGFAAPAWLLYVAFSDWIALRAVIPARNGPDFILTGPAARAVAIVYLGAALFCHARWFWGLKGTWTTFERLTILASLTIIAGMAAALWIEVKDAL